MNADDLRIYWVSPELFSMGGASQCQDSKLLKSLVSRCLPWLHLKCPKNIFGSLGVLLASSSPPLSTWSSEKGVGKTFPAEN